MNDSNIPEYRKLASAVSAVAFMVWGVVPMYVLGCLVSAVGRHEEAENAIKAEPVYEFILWWQGGSKLTPVVLLLISLVLLLVGLSTLLIKTGYAQPINGMADGRRAVQKVFIPMFLSGAAFGAGIISSDAVSGIFWSVTMLVLFAIVMAIVYYIIDLATD